MAFRRRQVGDDARDVPFDSSKVDFVSISADASTVLLYIVADSPWTGSDEQLNSLQLKIHGYVAFALDGQMVRLHPETAGLAWRIVIDAQAGAPDARSARVIDEVAEAVRRCGGDLAIG
jgi:hypothetical protein